MQLISPEKVFRGNGAWLKALPQIKKITKRPLILGRSFSTTKLRDQIFKDLQYHNFDIHVANLQFDCCDEDLIRVKNIISTDF